MSAGVPPGSRGIPPGGRGRHIDGSQANGWRSGCGRSGRRSLLKTAGIKSLNALIAQLRREIGGGISPPIHTGNANTGGNSLVFISAELRPGNWSRRRCRRDRAWKSFIRGWRGFLRGRDCYRRSSNWGGGRWTLHRTGGRRVIPCHGSSNSGINSPANHAPIRTSKRLILRSKASVFYSKALVCRFLEFASSNISGHPRLSHLRHRFICRADKFSQTSIFS